jgi:hypothetical protein
VDFLEHYSKEAARRKMIYLVQFGLHAYFSHKVAVLKGQCNEIFDRAVSKFFRKFAEIFAAQRCTVGVVDTGGKWKKSVIIKVIIFCLDTFEK